MPGKEAAESSPYADRKVNHLFSALFVRRCLEAGNADAEEDQVPLTNVRNPLTAVRRNEDDVTWTYLGGGQFAKLHPAATLENDVSLADPAKAVPAGCHARSDSGTGDRSFPVSRPIAELNDVAPFGRVEFAAVAEWNDCGLHGRLS